MREARELIHGTCVALGNHAALIRGRSGSGKSDLALRFLALSPEPGLEPRLVADDQGLGILEAPHRVEARLALAVDLVLPQDVPRMPSEPRERITIAGVAIPVVRLAPFELSAALKLKLALLSAVSQSSHQQA